MREEESSALTSLTLSTRKVDGRPARSFSRRAVFWQPPFAAADDFPPHLSYIGELSITSPMLGLSIPPTIEIGHLDLPSWSGLDSYQRMSTLFRLTIIVRAHLTINRLIGSVLCQEPSNLCASLFRSLVSPCLSLTSRIYPRA